LAYLSLKEAAAVAELSEAAVRRAIERKGLAPRSVSVGAARRWRLGVKDVLYVKLLAACPLRLGAADKRALRDLIHRRPPSTPWRSDDGALTRENDGVTLRIETGAARRMLARNLRDLRRGRRRIVSDPMTLGGEPVFAGTRIPLSHIAGLLRKGAPLAEIFEDYPSLSEADVAYAGMHARMSPPPGRPRKPIELRRMGARDRAPAAG
jgi:uncharacterized protein (DUF433 family)